MPRPGQLGVAVGNLLLTRYSLTHNSHTRLEVQQVVTLLSRYSVVTSKVVPCGGGHTRT
mgnify:CR=1 FL=1